MKQQNLLTQGEMLKLKNAFNQNLLPQYKKLKAAGGKLTPQQERMVARVETKKPK